MTDVQLPPTTVLAIEDITPYWRNPRKIPEEAIEAVRVSIERYGYQQPIVVDHENVIIVGHTRLQALLRLGWTHVPVYVTDLPADKAREYRLVDNKTGEMTAWDHDALVMELREWEVGLLKEFFPDVDLQVGQITGALEGGTMADAERKVTQVAPQDPAGTHTTKVVCPACFVSFDVRTRSLPGLTTADLDELAYSGGKDS
jgi:hypothetical protein